uniref:Intron-binding protein aquarius n=1 Tax=Compsopogon caeruleus TaxID=31354 RepID=A0A7S1TC51_9RHOD|mmetsp:Transcript_16972/g.35218  ORF Transcript_16972/g.35218 Transcript_16972/m.35218 type:complete len:1406 (+) Transcript_16972:271-4488(+)
MGQTKRPGTMNDTEKTRSKRLVTSDRVEAMNGEDQGAPRPTGSVNEAHSVGRMGEVTQQDGQVERAVTDKEGHGSAVSPDQHLVDSLCKTLSGTNNVWMRAEESGVLERWLMRSWMVGGLATSYRMFAVGIMAFKFHARLATWDPFLEKMKEKGERWSAVIRDIVDLALKSEHGTMNDLERVICVRFLSAAFQTLEHEPFRIALLPFLSSPLLMQLSKERREQEILENPSLERQVQYLAKKRQTIKYCMDYETAFPNLLRRFLNDLFDLDKIQEPRALNERIGVLKATMDMIVDLLSQLSTRRFLRLFMEDTQFVPMARYGINKGLPLAAGAKSFALISKLLDMAEYYARTEIDSSTGEPVSRDEMISKESDRLSSVQLALFAKTPESRDLALANHSSLRKSDTLMKSLTSLSEEELCSIAREVGCYPNLPLESLPVVKKDVLINCLMSFCSSSFNSMMLRREPIYPTEADIWDAELGLEENLAWSETFALPKLNLQFLTMHDYLLRNYTLLQLQAKASIRVILLLSLSRMQPYVDHRNELQFRGWSSTATPLTSFSILEKHKEDLADRESGVICDVEYGIGDLRGEPYREWNMLSEHDILLLIRIDLQLLKSEAQESATRRFGVAAVRGAEVVSPLDIDGAEIHEWNMFQAKHPSGGTRRVRCVLDEVQYMQDVATGSVQYSSDSFNVAIRFPRGKSCFKSILETVRNLADVVVNRWPSAILPEWLSDVILGYNETHSSESDPETFDGKWVDYSDTFIDRDHLLSCLPNAKLEGNMTTGMNVRIRSSPDGVLVEPYPVDGKRNRVRFTSRQVEAIRSAMNPGLSIILGPPGTGKTDVAVQAIVNLYRDNPRTRILVITHSNSALNDIFVKLLERNGIKEGELIRVGQGSESIDVESSFGKVGRLNYLLRRRIQALQEVQELANAMNIPGDHGYTCETASLFYKNYVLPALNHYHDQLEQDSPKPIHETVSSVSPFSSWPGSVGLQSDGLVSERIKSLFKEIELLRPFELIRNNKDRTNYLVTKHARIIAMTSTHAAMLRDHYVNLGFSYDTVVVEEAGQILEIESFMSLILQSYHKKGARLERCILLGDHKQLPPVVENVMLTRVSNFEQSMLARFVRLGNRSVTLDAQGRCRPEIAELYRWMYPDLRDLPSIASESPLGRRGHNPGFKANVQVIDVWMGDESEPTPHYFQNLAEAEYIAAVYQYMRLIGYPSTSIAVLTTYRGQQELIKDVIRSRVAWNPVLGSPRISTVDKFQGQQSDFILLSLVRTRKLGHFRDIRRMIVALSRARLGLYIFCRVSLLSVLFQPYEVFQNLLKNKTLTVVRGEEFDKVCSGHSSDDEINIDSPAAMSTLVRTIAASLEVEFADRGVVTAPEDSLHEEFEFSASQPPRQQEDAASSRASRFV